MTNRADPDQLASSGSTLFAKTEHVLFSKRRVKIERMHYVLSIVIIGPDNSGIR